MTHHNTGPEHEPGFKGFSISLYVSPEHAEGIVNALEDHVDHLQDERSVRDEQIEVRP